MRAPRAGRRRPVSLLWGAGAVIATLLTAAVLLPDRSPASDATRVSATEAAVADGSAATGYGAEVDLARSPADHSGAVPVWAEGGERSARGGSDSESGARIDFVETAGVFAPTTPITAANLTVVPGRYLVSYSFDVRVTSTRHPARLTCGIVDANGSPGFLAEGVDPVEADAGWQRQRFAATFSLPDVTIGARCFVDEVALAHVQFRDVLLSVTRISG